jgi:excisionase family DNA binding protein
VTAALDADTRHLLRVLGETALRMSEGRQIDRHWLEAQFSTVVPTAPTPVGDRGGLLTVSEACARLRVSRWSFYRLIQERHLMTVTIGRRRLVRRTELERFVSTLSETGGAT